MFAFEKLPGLPRERIVEAIAPVLRAHGLQGVELIWRTDAGGRVLSLTLEAAGSESAGSEASTEGVTLDVCSRVSRDVSTALDVLELINGAYRLEVGTPGLERRLYGVSDFNRFKGRAVKLKLAKAVEGQFVLEGTVAGVDAGERALITVQEQEHAVSLEDIRSAQLVVDWQEMGFAPRQRAGRRSAANGRK
jgi:ribosome maturation factor RimP